MESFSRVILGYFVDFHVIEGFSRFTLDLVHWNPLLYIEGQNEEGLSRAMFGKKELLNCIHPS